MEFSRQYPHRRHDRERRSVIRHRRIRQFRRGQCNGFGCDIRLGACDSEWGYQRHLEHLVALALLGGGTAGVADRGYAELGSGIDETVFALVLCGVPQSPGTYGSTLSGATFKINEYFSGNGMITVLEPEPASVGLMLLGLAVLEGRHRRR